MIFNNHVGMELIRARKDDPLTPTLVLDIHRRMTAGTLPETSSGQAQSPRDVCVRVGSSSTGEVLHEPPPAEMLPERMQALCDFVGNAMHFSRRRDCCSVTAEGLPLEAPVCGAGVRGAGFRGAGLRGAGLRGDGLRGDGLRAVGVGRIHRMSGSLLQGAG